MKTPALLFLLCGSAALVSAATTDASAERCADRLTGDWGGARADLSDAGVDVFAYYNAIFAGNVSGGVSRDSDYAGDLFSARRSTSRRSPVGIRLRSRSRASTATATPSTARSAANTA